MERNSTVNNNLFPNLHLLVAENDLSLFGRICRIKIKFSNFDTSTFQNSSKSTPTKDWVSLH